MTRPRLLVFGRAARPGEAKTRLIPALGEQGAARLSADLLEHGLAVGAEAGPARLELWHAGGDDAGELAALARRFGAERHEQPAGDLGARMRHALERATADGASALVMGSDAPLLTPEDLCRAMTALSDRDAVLGPATDGGYVLLGVHEAAPHLFRGIAWGGDDVAMTTRQRFAELCWHWLELPAQPDIDRPEDLASLAALGPAWRDWASAAKVAPLPPLDTGP
jgi:rSAM/selenodomain-associated transferase 1